MLLIVLYSKSICIGNLKLKTSTRRKTRGDEYSSRNIQSMARLTSFLVANLEDHFLPLFGERHNQFFESRIISERIEHWIEPEQRRS